MDSAWTPYGGFLYEIRRTKQEEEEKAGANNAVHTVRLRYESCQGQQGVQCRPLVAMLVLLAQSNVVRVEAKRTIDISAELAFLGRI